GTDLAGQVFLPGVRAASSSLSLSSGSVTLDAQGDPGAVFIFQIGSTLITGSNTSVALINGAQACNVFWQVGSSATLGTGTRFVGTVMANASISAKTAATIHGRLLARTGAVTLDTNTITTSTCAGGSETQTPAETSAGITPTSTGTVPPIASKTPLTPAQRAAEKRAAQKRAAQKRAARRRALAKRALPHKRGTFTG
ncbi:MAG TPA: ice-binding family protein, partial [Solirubrobacteraceae bacterium]